MKKKIVRFSEIAADKIFNLSAEYWINKENENPTTTIPNSRGKVYSIGDEFVLCIRWQHNQKDCCIVAISPSRKFFRVSHSTSMFSIETLQERKGGNKLSERQYLIPKNKHE